jgi:hypothetical protein
LRVAETQQIRCDLTDALHSPFEYYVILVAVSAVYPQHTADQKPAEGSRSAGAGDPGRGDRRHLRDGIQ